MTTATLSTSLGLDLRGYDFMDLMRDAGMIPSKAPLPLAPAPKLAALVTRIQSLHRDWNYDFMDLMRDAGALSPQPAAEAPAVRQPLGLLLRFVAPQHKAESDLPRAA